MKILLFFFLIHISFLIHGQEIVKLVFVGDHGITEKEKEAKYIIAIKNYGDTLFESLEYNYAGPLIRLINYKDTLMTIKEGRYCEYSPNGIISTLGYYHDNLKHGKWTIYDKNRKAKFQYEYANNKVLNIIDLDSLQKASKKEKSNKFEIETSYKGDQSEFSDKIQSKIEELINHGIIKIGGDMLIRFTINPKGQITDFLLAKSIQISIDEIILEVMRSLHSEWMPASINGITVNAYREQPISVSFK